MVNVGTYTIHGRFGSDDFPFHLVIFGVQTLNIPVRVASLNMTQPTGFFHGGFF